MHIYKQSSKERTVNYIGRNRKQRIQNWLCFRFCSSTSMLTVSIGIVVIWSSVSRGMTKI